MSSHTVHFPFPSVNSAFLCLSITILHNLGGAHGALGDYGAQKDLLERALKIKEQHLGTDHPEVAGTLHNLGNAHVALGDPPTQKDLMERA